MLVHLLASANPVGADGGDVAFGYEVRDRLDALGKLRILAQPARVDAGQGDSDAQHVDLPCGVKATPTFAPLDVPVPDDRKDEKTEGEALQRHAEAMNGPARRRRQGAEHQAQMLDPLRGGFLAHTPLR